MSVGAVYFRAGPVETIGVVVTTEGKGFKGGGVWFRASLRQVERFFF